MSLAKLLTVLLWLPVLAAAAVVFMALAIWEDLTVRQTHP